MHNTKTIVINTGPIIALVAALGDLSVMKDAIQRMKSHGIWLSEGVIAFALSQVGESN